jgi:hypothetical protein
MSYEAYATSVVESGILSDPWVDGQPRLRQKPLVLSEREQRTLYRAAEEMAAVYDELCRIVRDEPTLLDSFFASSGTSQRCWIASLRSRVVKRPCGIRRSRSGTASLAPTCS